MRLLLCSLATAAVGLLIAPAVASACSCAQPPPPAVALESAGIVFEGTVTSVPGAPAEGALGGVGKHEYRFSVAQSWKGTPGMELRVLTNASSAACGRVYQKGQTYLIYGTMDEEASIYDTLCSRSRTLASAGEDLAVLGAGQPPRARGGAGKGSAPIEAGTPAGEPGSVPVDSGPNGASPAGDTGSAAETPTNGAADGAVEAETVEPAEAPKVAADETEDEPAPKGEPKEGCSLAASGAIPALALLLPLTVGALRRRAGSRR